MGETVVLGDVNVKEAEFAEFSGSWVSFTVSVGKHRCINFGRVETADAAMLKRLMGNSEFVVIRINGHEVIRKFNHKHKGSYQFMMPEYVGNLKPKDEITVWVKPLSREEFIKSAVKSLPLNLRLELESDDEGMLYFMDALCFPVRVTRFEWSRGNNALEVDLTFKAPFRGSIKPHTIAIAVKGDEKRAIIRFTDTSGEIRSIRLGELLGEIVVEYHDYDKKYIPHSFIPEGVKLLYEAPKEWTGMLKLRRLSKEEVEKVKKWIGKNQQALYGNLIRDILIKAVQESSEIAGKEMDPNSMNKEVSVYCVENGRRTEKGRLDIVFKARDGKLIVVEVKATTDPENIQEQYSVALKELKTNPGYISLIRKYGLEVFDRVWNDSDVEAYIVIVVRTNL